MVRAVVESGLSRAEVARRFNTTIKTASKWVRRYLAEGLDGLHDRSSRPHLSPRQTPLATCDAVENLRRKRRTQDHIARDLGLSSATVSRILKQRGISLLSQLEPKKVRPRYERETPAKSSISTSKSWGNSSVQGTASLATGAAKVTIVVLGRNMYTSPSTTAPVLPIAIFFLTRKRKVRWLTSGQPSPIMATSVLRSSVSCVDGGVILHHSSGGISSLRRSKTAPPDNVFVSILIWMKQGRGHENCGTIPEGQTGLSS